MTVRELREKYLRFFESKGHSIFPSGSLIPYDVTGRLDESLLFNGAGMIQFKPYFRGVATPENRRLTTCQKCVRTGDIESVGDLSHLTFFEMLGNFSFGDYFKTQAIAFSWEFLTSPEWLGLDPNRLSFTVFQEDDEAYEAWSSHLRAAGINPEWRVFRLGEETNYWPAGAFSGGPPGPCGPNSEMFYWTSNEVPPPSGPYSVEDWIRDDDARNWLEIWNDVFIQFEWQGELHDATRPNLGYRKTGMPELPFRSIDTGMGLERTAAVLGGFDSVYDTDAFLPIFAKIQSLTPRPFGEGGRGEGELRAERIIADHIRTACFCIADGILPGNNGRGYVLRRLIRRAVLKGQRVLGFEEVFLPSVAEAVIETFAGHYAELQDRWDIIRQTLQNEEELFRRTLKSGEVLLSEEIAKLKSQIDQLQRAASLSTGTGRFKHPALDGAVAFKLYDTFGFPLEVTQELCEEAGIDVDVEGYEAALVEAQARSRGAQSMDTVYGGVVMRFDILMEEEVDGKPTPTEFLGYERLAAPAKVKGVLMQPMEDDEIVRLVVALDKSPFYSASGGQISDMGVLRGDGFEGRVTEVLKQDGLIIHEVEATKLPVPVLGKTDDESRDALNKALFNQDVFAEVDAERRRSIQRNHTATHLLHAALRQVLGKHVTQAGSYVGPDRLRFDFTHNGAMSPDELAQVERIVNEQALMNTAVVTYADLPISEAKARGAMALFGEKYGDVVRMVEIGDFSRELCGGTHVRSTGEIGLFRILSEASAASGVRRIEAVTGLGAYENALHQSAALKEAAGLLKAGVDDVSRGIERLIEQVKDERRKRERAEQQALKGGGNEAAKVAVGSVFLLAKDFGEVDQKIAASALDEAVAQDPLLVAVGAVRSGDKAVLMAKVGPQAVAAGAHAGNLVRDLAKIAGGGGGGRPDFATAGAKDLSKLGDALAAAAGVLEGMV